ncbi:MULTISPECIES: SMC family ATPase [Rhodococcus]|uniref:Nuclease SbcCD subunit C n=1 Tax=Rhodococcus oxybenzonivorans TaxID=1990687 RepID=A0AAE4UX26_9NOCA|nr:MULTISPECIES: SMC family ATPase [Rhodococcus]MDV7246559.1 SMC family ATPase [Rhodococcus oxybenzonivorans]MDV7264555.1 SMC family ATPase [Rhodococcus oxybenzonivorans]MDV7278181.1 SMC family ATPase [Rhodococcus oxybenzonivorans]MDV7337506.1 SMC family ATPase [Rhodococcus oxybenzonivorans]MDV7347769.1 SMC family ATPase [Rhodococcus oxybenzonivorans]
MRLHRLEVEAFGPFANSVEVDFDRLGADGLFLLHGQTGAGKTTVLDAVAFALYGTVPGARRDGKRLLSDHAPAGSVPTVTLEVTISGRRLRLVRSPEFERPKRRGSGTIKENAKATLTWLDGRGEHLSRIPDIAEEIGRLMGMSADQFFQVVLLPQGEFARFLRADNEERGQLLERLFDTTRFGTVEEWFLNRRRASAHDLDEHQRSIDVLIAKVATAAGIEGGADADPVTWAHKLEEEARATRDVAVDELEKVKSDAALTRDALAQARRILELQNRRTRAEAELAAYEAGASERAVLAAEVAAARRAEPVAVVVREADAARDKAATAARRVAAIADRLCSTAGGAEVVEQLSWPPNSEEREHLRTCIRSWRDDVVRLDGVLAEAEVGDRLDVELGRLRAREVGLADTRAELAREREELPGAIRVAERALDEAEKARVSLPGLEDVRARAADAAAAAAELRQCRDRRDALERAVLDARRTHQDAREHWLTFLQRRILGMAAELAGTLEDGKPCQVCGSVEHPDPAAESELSVTKADEDAALAAEQKAAAQVNTAAEALATADRTIDVLVQRCGDGDADHLGAELASAEAALRHASDLGEQAASRARHLGELRDRETQLHTRSHDLAVEAATVAEKITSGAAQLEEIRARVREAAGEDESPAARRARIAVLADAASELLDARDEGAAAESSAQELAAKAELLAREAGFDRTSDAVAAVRPVARQDEIDARLTAARDAEVGARRILDEPEIAAVADAAPVDLGSVQQAHDAAMEAVDVAVAVASEAERRLLDLERFVGQLERAAAAIAPMQAEHEELAALAEVIAGRGQNSRKMSLRSYVLAARLEEVAVSASARLSRMSAGRYSFVHTDEAGPRGRRGGLGLDIRDDYTGVVRSAKTLSGGESFLASLSLALGLADVVAAESGGVVLDTMFIDEGFGTLDADTLDSVMGVLDELRDGGRVVGIVSHVDEMRQRIPSRLHVVRGRTGSTLEVIAG